MNLQPFIIPGLVTLAIGGVAWVFLLPILSGEKQAEKRRESVARSEPVSRTARTQRSRRDQVEETLKELDQRSKRPTSPPLSVRIAQAGLSWSKQRFFLTAVVFGVVVFVLALGGGIPLPAAAGFAFSAAGGAPFWYLSFLKKRREARFLEAFPDAVDVIVRGIKSGLPLHECFRVIAADAPEPVRSEFRSIVETQAIGLPLGEVCAKMYERIPLAEANFFAIVIGIQQKAGGNLSEALGNLSRVLRDRKRMKAKIKAMSMEAKASAGIIGSLPIAVMGLVYMTSPDYISLLWTENLGRVMLAGSAVWMTMGILVMKKMINFDF